MNDQSRKAHATGRGGARTGSGRKSDGRKRASVSFWLDKELRDRFRAEMKRRGMTASEFLDYALRKIGEHASDE